MKSEDDEEELVLSALVLSAPVLPVLSLVLLLADPAPLLPVALDRGKRCCRSSAIARAFSTAA